MVGGGNVIGDGVTIEKTAFAVAVGARLIVNVPAPTPATAIAEQIPLDII